MFWIAVPIVASVVVRAVVGYQEEKARAKARRRRRALERERERREEELRREAARRQAALRRQQQQDRLAAAARARAAADRLRDELHRDQAALERQAGEARRLAQTLEAELPRSTDPAQREALGESLNVARELLAHTKSAQAGLVQEGRALKRTRAQLVADRAARTQRRLPRR